MNKLMAGILIWAFLLIFDGLVAQNKRVNNPAACLGLKGEVCLAWISNEGLCFMRSENRGITWPLTHTVITQVKNAGSYSINGLSLISDPVIVCDTGQSRFRGRLYISWSDEKYGPKNSDVFLVFSDDRGETWTEPILVTYRPNHKEQFKPAMTVDAKSGRVSLAYFDRQNYISAGKADVYLALSYNGGLQFNTYRLNQEAIKLETGNPLTLWFSQNSNDSLLINWAARKELNKKMMATQVLVNDSLIANYNSVNSFAALIMERSFVFSSQIKLSFKSPVNTSITAIVTKPLEPAFEKLVVKDFKCIRGENTLLINTKTLGLAKANYVLTFYYNNQNSYVWITE